MNTYPCGAAIPDSRCLATPTYPARECTSYAAWMGSQRWGRTWPLAWGNAGNWPNAARRVVGFRVDTVPEVGSVMALGPLVNGAGQVGHVAWVEGIGADTVTVSEYDFSIRFGYDVRDFPIVGALFIHLPEAELQPYLATTTRAAGETPDPHGPGAVYYVAEPFKRWISSGAIFAQLRTLYGAPRDMSATPYTLDHMVELEPWDVTYPTLGWTR